MFDSMIQFYAPNISETPILPESDSQHCVRVLRMKEGDTIEELERTLNKLVSEEEYEKAAVVNKILKEKSKHQP